MWTLVLQLGRQEVRQLERSKEDLTGHAGHGQVSVSHCLYRRTLGKTPTSSGEPVKSGWKCRELLSVQATAGSSIPPSLSTQRD